MRRLLIPATFALTLGACAVNGTQTPLLTTTQAQQAQLAYSGFKTAVSIYLVASKASPATVQAVAKAEAALDPQIAAVGSLNTPNSFVALSTDVNQIVAALPSGALNSQQTEYVMLVQAITNLAATLGTTTTQTVNVPHAS